MQGKMRRPLAAERREDRPGSEENKVHNVWRYDGIDPTRELHISIRFLN